MNSLVGSFRLAIVTMLICVVAYTTLILSFAQIVAGDTAQGSLILNDRGEAIGSRLVAQKFTQPHYFWPRPSAVDYNASATGASNKSPTSSDLTARANQVIALHNASDTNPLPAELAAASGSGLDPHITEQAALYQVKRIAQARDLPDQKVKALVKKHAFTLGLFLNQDRLVNVLELNLALDALGRS